MRAAKAALPLIDICVANCISSSNGHNPRHADLDGRHSSTERLFVVYIFHALIQAIEVGGKV